MKFIILKLVLFKWPRFFYKRQTNAETLVGFRGLIFRASAQSLENQVKNNSFFTAAAAVLEFAI